MTKKAIASVFKATLLLHSSSGFVLTTYEERRGAYWWFFWSCFRSSSKALSGAKEKSAKVRVTLPKASGGSEDEGVFHDSLASEGDLGSVRLSCSIWALLLSLGTFPISLLSCLFYLVWNCQGAASKRFSNVIRDLVAFINNLVIVLVEPRISGWKAEKVINKIGYSGKSRVEAQGFSGGIWVLWKEEVVQKLMCWLSISNTCTSKCQHDKWFFIAVYASPVASLRKNLWSYLAQLVGNRTVVDSWWFQCDLIPGWDGGAPATVGADILKSFFIFSSY